MEDSEFELPGSGGPGSGARTPFVNDAAKQTKQVFNRMGDIAGKVAGDFTGKQVTKSTHPNQVTIALLSSTNGSQVLARRLYRTFAREETETVYSEDLQNAFENEEEATAAFSMFDKDMNGDISMEELEAVCVEIGRERKSITASLKDLDSVVAKLDDVFMFIVAVITILVFISLISTSAAGVLTSAGSAVLALSWLFSATAQEFLQSVIFVFVKHPFDVGDRVGIYGNTGALGRGDDYFVKEISLLYTEFKKMEGHVVRNLSVTSSY
jgi:small-conductance mechanosensitive channel